MPRALQHVSLTLFPLYLTYRSYCVTLDNTVIVWAHFTVSVSTNIKMSTIAVSPAAQASQLFPLPLTYTVSGFARGAPPESWRRSSAAVARGRPGALRRNIRINDTIRNLCIREGSADGKLIGRRDELAGGARTCFYDALLERHPRV